MLTGIDHLVVVVPDLEEAVRRYGDLGFTVVPGGRHTAGTHNALIPFGDGAYVELIAFFEPLPAHRWWPFAERGGGFVDMCLGTDAFARDVAALRAAGLDVDGPRPLTRTRPDGYVLRWSLATPRPPLVGAAPFLIEDDTPRAERVPTPPVHRNGAVAIESVTLVADDIEAPRAWYDATGTPIELVARPDLGGAGVRARVGPHVLEYLAPTGDRGPLAEWRRAHGASPYAATLKTSGGVAGAIDPARACGARFRFV